MINFNREGSPYEKIGIGKISRAEVIWGLLVVYRNKSYAINEKDLHSILKALTEKRILWGLIDSYFPEPPEEGDKFELHFLKTPLDDGFDYWDLHSLKGKDIKYRGKMYIIPPHDNL